MRSAVSARKYIIGLLLLWFAGPAFAAEPSSSALFWAIETEQGRAGYLLGTIHSEDPRVLEFSESFLDAMNSCTVFAMELVPNLPTLSSLAAEMRLPEGQDLAGVAGQQRFEATAIALGAYGVPRTEVARMKPWAAMMTLSVPPPKTGFFMDFSLSLRASGQGLEVIGLETLDEQLAFLEDMTLDQQLSMLDQAVAEAGRVQEVHDRMVDVYLEGDLAKLMKETQEQLSDLDDEVRELFMEQGIEARNRRMFAGLNERLGRDRVFAAVGSLHLPGDQGLLALLRKAGYRLRAMPQPFLIREAAP